MVLIFQTMYNLYPCVDRRLHTIGNTKVLFWYYLFWVRRPLKKLSVLAPFEKYAQHYVLKLKLYLLIEEHRDYSKGKMVEFVKKEIMSPISELLGVFVKDNRVNIADIQNLLSINEEIWNATKTEGYSKLFPFLEKINIEFMRNFKFIFQRDHFFKFIYNYYV